jgi:predicted metallo-beta-lactamase superfamily hydrolase
MEITFLGTESLGVRGLCCRIRAAGRTILIDPGVALGPLRYGLPPHPAEVAAAARVRETICCACGGATDVVFSHYHGDHVPLASPSPYQLPLARVAFSGETRLWYKGPALLSRRSLRRRDDLIGSFGRVPVPAEGHRDGTIAFSHTVSHGSTAGHTGGVMMTCIRDGDEIFVHASDMQLLDRTAVATIIGWGATTVFASGPPLYIPALSLGERKIAWEHAKVLAGAVDRLILDHHLLRSRQGFAWLGQLSALTGTEVTCAAGYGGTVPLLLEAGRNELYRKMPVPDGWHDAYRRGEVSGEELASFLAEVG